MMKFTKFSYTIAMLLITINSFAANFYWVNGSGNWSDTSHWAFSSGGTILHNQWPGGTDNVFFDANSFSAPGQIVTLDQGITNCADMTWTTLPTAFPILYGDSSKTFRIWGSLTIATVIGFNFTGEVIMEAMTAGKTITTGGTPINFHWTFNGAGGGWTFQDALMGSSVINFINGTLNTNNQTINASAFYSVSGGARTMIMGSSIFNLKGYNNGLWNINPLGMTLNAGTSTINGTSTIGSEGNFYGGGLTYYNLSFADSASIFGNNTFHDVAFVADGFISGNNSFHDVSFFLHAIINGNSTFNNVIMSSNGNINGSNTFNNLTFSPWWTYTLQAGATQTIGNICAQGTGALPIRIQSSIAGTPAIISKASGSICWDYVRVSDITASGGAIFNAGLAPTNSQDLGGNTGLLFTGGCTAMSCLSSCNPPSITMQPVNSSVCVGSNAVFTITATGTDLTYQWQINQGFGFINLNNNIQYSGVTSNTLNIIAPAILFNGYQYRCAAVGACPIVSMSSAATLTVKPSPTVTVNSAIICSGQTAILTASAGTVFVPVAPLLPPSPPLPPPPTTTSYIWSTGETTNSISVAPPTTSTYTVTGTTNGCSGTAIATVTVNSSPIVNAGQDATVVSNTPVQLGSAPVPSISYSWSPTTGLSNAAVSNPTLVLQNNDTTPQTFSYILIATNGTCTKTDTVLITISPSSTPAINQKPDLDDEMSKPNANFYDIQSRMEAWFQANLDTTEVDGERAEFARWQWFWQGRVDDAITQSKSGGFKAADRALAAYIQDPVCNTPENITSNWTGLGPFTQPNPVTDQNMGVIHSLFVDPQNNNNIFAGSFTSGLFKTINGESFNPTWSNPDVSRLPAMGVRSIAIDPTSNNQTIYVATGMAAMGRPGYGIGVLKSTDGGVHWQQTALTFTPTSAEWGNFNVYKILMHPNNPNIIYAITDKKVYITTDGFATVVESTIPLGPTNRHFRDIQFRPGSSNTLFISGTNEILQSINGGLFSYTSVTSNLTDTANLDRLAISATADNLYVYYLSNGQSRIDKYKFNNGTWSNVSTPNLGKYNYVFVVSPEDSLIMYLGQGQNVLQKSTNGGLNFFPITYYSQPFNGTYTHSDIRTLQLVQASVGGTADKLYVGNDGGILKTTNGGTSWTNINGTGLNITQFYGIGGTESNPNLIVGGSQDNGFYTYNAPNWTVKVVGDAYDACIDKVDPNFMFGAANGGPNNNYLRKSIYGGGLSWIPMNQPFGASLTNRPLFIDNNNNWYTGYHDVFKSTNQGGSWYAQQGNGSGTKISDFSTFNNQVNLQDGTIYNSVPPDKALVALAVASSNPNVIYAAYPGATWGTDPLTGISCGGCQEALAKKIFRTTDGGNSWTDITAGLEAVRWTGITHIAVDPNDPYRIWVSFNDIWSSGVDVDRVFYGHYVNGAWTWTDHSVGLPQFPVSSIVYQDGSDDGLYVGTDVGVYYTDNTIYPQQGWVCYSSNLPVVIVTDLEINNCTGKIRAATHGRGLWESPLVPPPAKILASGTISTPVSYTSDLTIPNGNTVIITSTINMAAERKITVERGGILTINGGTITNDCGSMWHGIEVLGDRTKSQYLTSGVQLQGKIILNNATIENAREGIVTIKTDANGTMDWDYTGGIIRAVNSTFLNCRRAVSYLSYQNFNPLYGNNANNLGYFKHCNFLTTGQLKDRTIKPYAFVSLCDVQGVRFMGNTFKNTATVSQNQGYKGNGIISIDANYSVNSYCSVFPPPLGPCPIANTVHNHFENLVYGINASAGIAPLKAITVNNNEFVNNDYGIYIKEIYNPTITSNTFDVAGTWLSYGVYIDNSTRFKLEDNHFTTSHNGYIGSYINNSVNNSQSNANTVYNNYYEKLVVGNIAANDNYDNVNLLGLKINCDDFTNGNQFDNAVIPIENPNTDIDLFQGTCTSDPKTLVRNYYSASCSGNENQYYVDKTSTNPIVHFNSIESWAKPACNDPLVMAYSCNGIFRNRTSDCPSTIGNTYSKIKSDIAKINAQLSPLKATLDAGAAQSLITSINSAMPAGSLKNVLMAKSPYLSDQVSIAYIKKTNTPPPGNLKDIVIANSPVATPVKDALNTISLPPGIRNQIDAAQTGISERTKLEGQIAVLNSEKDMLISDNIGLFLNDTMVSSPMDSVIKILKVENRINTKAALIDAYIEKKDFANAQQEINILRSAGNVDALCDFKQLIISLQQSIEGAYRMKTDASLKTQIETIANDPTNGSSKYAQALLQKVFESGFQEEVLLPVNNGTRSLIISDTVAQSIVRSTKVYPNPAKNSINFEVNFETDTILNSYLIIRDIVGRQMGKYTITPKNTPLIVNTESYSNGIYFYSVYNNGVLKETEKFIISK